MLAPGLRGCDRGLEEAEVDSFDLLTVRPSSSLETKEA